MPYKTILLSDGLPCRVRQLGLFELNGKGRAILGPYCYSMLLATGQVVEDEYELRALEETPKPPDLPAAEIKPGSMEWYALNEYETYLAAMAHEKRRVESYHGYVDDVVAYILANCLKAEDCSRIVTPEDWDAVYQAALVPELTIEVISATLRDVFQSYIWWAGDIRRPFRHLHRSRADGSRRLMGV